MSRIRVWDPAVRIFHWTLAVAFAANALFVDDDGDLHQWIGWMVVSLVLFRIVWGLSGSKHARFSDFPPSVSRALGQLREIARGEKRIHTGHTPLGAWMIYNLLLTMLVIGASGYLMTTDMFWGVEWPEEVHEAAVTWAEISVVLHIVAVVLESWRTRVNLPRAMLTGYKELPGD
ncbi:MAG: cytochrome b/b6 domain-containing protein [Geminicoccaceae bacterium]